MSVSIAAISSSLGSRANTLQDHTDMLALVGLIAQDEGDEGRIEPEPDDPTSPF